jgi:hypothetical protein
VYLFLGNMDSENFLSFTTCGRVAGFGFRVPGFGLWVPGSKFSVPGLGFGVPGSKFSVPGFGFRVPGFGFRASGSVFGFPGFGFRVPISGFGFRGDLHRAQPERAGDSKLSEVGMFLLGYPQGIVHVLVIVCLHLDVTPSGTTRRRSRTQIDPSFYYFCTTKSIFVRNPN